MGFIAILIFIGFVFFFISKKTELSELIAVSAIIWALGFIFSFALCLMHTPFRENLERIKVEEQLNSIQQQIELVKKLKEENTNFNGIVVELMELNKEIQEYNTKVKQAKLRRSNLIFKDFEYCFWEDFEPIEPIKLYID